MERKPCDSKYRVLFSGDVRKKGHCMQSEDETISENSFEAMFQDELRRGTKAISDRPKTKTVRQFMDYDVADISPEMSKEVKMFPQVVIVENHQWT
eukprot:gene20212-22188_t